MVIFPALTLVFTYYLPYLKQPHVSLKSKIIIYPLSESDSSISMFGVHTDFIYTDYSRTVFKSTIRILKY